MKAGDVVMLDESVSPQAAERLRAGYGSGPYVVQRVREALPGAPRGYVGFDAVPACVKLMRENDSTPNIYTCPLSWVRLATKESK